MSSPPSVAVCSQVLAWRHRSVREVDFRALSALLGELCEA